MHFVLPLYDRWVAQGTVLTIPQTYHGRRDATRRHETGGWLLQTPHKDRRRCRCGRPRDARPLLRPRIEETEAERVEGSLPLEVDLPGCRKSVLSAGRTGGR